MPPGPSATRPTQPIVGRDDLLARSRTILAEARGVVFRGAAGSGTTRLVRELCSGVPARELLELRATESGATMPLGVFIGPLGDLLRAGADAAARPPGRPASPTELVRLAAQLRARVTDSGATVVAVDDAQLLDPPSAALLLDLAASGVRLVASLVEGVPPPDAVAALWRDGLCEVLSVPPLDEACSLALLAGALGGPVDHGLARALHTKSAGSPRLLIDAMDAALRSGAATRVAGVWVLATPLPALAPTDDDALRRRLARLDPGARRVLDVLSVASGLPLAEAEALLAADDLERAEAERVVEVVVLPAGGHLVRPVSPVIADAAVGDLAVLARRRILNELVAATVEASRGRAPDGADRTRLCRWRIDAGERVAVDELLAVAESVYVADPLLCSRLLGAAIAAKRDLGQSLRLAGLLAHSHRMDDAERVLDSIPEREREADRGGIVVATRAYLLTMVAHQPGRAITLLDAARGTVDDDSALSSVRTTALWAAGDFAGAVATGEPLVSDPSRPPVARAQAGSTLALVYISRGDRAAYDRVSALVAAVLPLAEAGMPEAEATRALQEVLVLLNVDRDLAGALSRARAGYDAALARGDDGLRTEFAHLLAWASVLGGDLAAAMPLFREALASRGMWSRTTRPWIETHYLRALLIGGSVVEARAVLARVLAAPHAPVHDVSIALAEAALLAAEGAVAAAGRRCAEAGDRVRSLGQFERAAAAWFAGLRWGDDGCARRLLEQADAAPGSIAPAVVAQARAWLSRDPSAAEAAANSFAAGGLLWYAIDAQSQAVLLRTERAEDPLPSAARLSVLRDRAPGFGASASTTLPGHPPITDREREVALLAVHGASDRAISATLGISVRTVNAHLRNVYAKTGLHGRAGLRHLLDP
jgi:DNA-binding CsgD family transcriptional regulator